MAGMIAQMNLTIRPLASPDTDLAEARRCAEVMASSDPWLTLGRTFEQCLASVQNREREVHVAYEGEVFRGFTILALHGALVGYIAVVAVAQDARGTGVGSALLDFAEGRIFERSPNAFLSVSSFNERARALYERRGYVLVGPMRDYFIRDYDELLMRKSNGTMREFEEARARV
jgi:ribosomal-protein-alanine N-acetyltransferase